MSPELARPSNDERAGSDTSRATGWVRERVLGFAGFASEADALRAGAVAHATLLDWLRSHGRTPRKRVPSGAPLPAWVEGDRLVVNGAAIGRFVRASDGERDERSGCGFELSLPAEMPDVVAKRVVERVHEAIGAS